MCDFDNCLVNPSQDGQKSDCESERLNFTILIFKWLKMLSSNFLSEYIQNNTEHDSAIMQYAWHNTIRLLYVFQKCKNYYTFCLRRNLTV